MSDTIIEMKKVDGWWAASSDAGHEQVSLYEVLNGRESLLEVMTVTVEDFPSLEDFKIEVKRIFGGGIYVAAVRGPNGTFAKRPQFAISGRPIREKAEDATPAGQVSGLDRVAELIAQGQRDMMAILAKMSEKPEAPDAFAMFEKAALILRDNGTTPAPQKNFFEQAAEFKQAAEVLGLGGGAEAAAPDLMGLASTLGVPLLDLLKEHAGVDKLKVAAALKLQQQRAPQGKPAKVTTLAPVATAQAVTDLPVGFDAMVSQLVGMAEAKNDPVEVAALVVQIAPDTEWLKTYLQRDDALAQFAQLVPAVNQHWDWFVDLANAALLALGVEQVVTDESGCAGNTDAAADTTAQPAPQPKAEHSGRQRRNVGNAPDHARPRSPRKAGPSRASPGIGTDQ